MAKENDSDRLDVSDQINNAQPPEPPNGASDEVRLREAMDKAYLRFADAATPFEKYSHVSLVTGLLRTLERLDGDIWNSLFVLDAAIKKLETETDPLDGLLMLQAFRRLYLSDIETSLEAGGRAFCIASKLVQGTAKTK